MVKNFTANKQIGKMGENLAEIYLKNSGFTILERNYRYSKYAEIDIIALKDNTVHFIEVKTRNKTYFGTPLEAINKKKLTSIFRCASYYLQQTKTKYDKFQIDALGILFSDNKNPEYMFVENISL